MKTNPTFKIFKLSTFVLSIAITLALSVRPAQAVPYVLTLQQVGSKVVATGSGALDLTGLTLFPGGATAGGGDMIPADSTIMTGAAGNIDIYQGTFSGPNTFGSGGETAANSNSGDAVDMDFNQNVAPDIAVPQGYHSDTALSSSSTWNFTLSALGVTPGTYVWTWGTGPDQSFTLDVVAPAGAPDSGSTFGLLLVALLGIIGVSRFKSLRFA